MVLNKGTLVVVYRYAAVKWAKDNQLDLIPRPSWHPLWRDATSSHLHLSCRSICNWITMWIKQSTYSFNVQSTNLQLSCCCIASPLPPPLPVCMSQVYLLQLWLELLCSLPRLSVSTASHLLSYNLTWSDSTSSARAGGRCNSNGFWRSSLQCAMTQLWLLILVLTVDHSVSDCSFFLQLNRVLLVSLMSPQKLIPLH